MKRAVLSACLGVVWAAIGLALVAGIGNAAAIAAASFQDSDLDGVWVGTLAAKASGTTRSYPLLLHVDADSKTLRGLLLIADDLAGAPTELQFVAITDATIKGKKVTFKAPVGGESRLHPLARSGNQHSFKLRNRKGVLKGTMTSTVPGISKSRLTLRPIDAAAPWQHVWVGTVGAATRRPGARAAGELFALYLEEGRALSGAGFVGTTFGSLDSIVDDGAGGLTAKLGDVDLTLQRDGLGLTGTAAGGVSGSIDASAGAGGTAARTVRKISPDELPAGKSTEVEITGTGFVPGMMLHVDQPDIYAGVVEVSKTTSASALITVPDSVADGTELRLQLMGPGGDTLEPENALRTGGDALISFRGDLQPIFSNRCALSGCHVVPTDGDPLYGDDGEAAGGLVLTMAQAYANLVNANSRGKPGMTRVIPGDPDNSYLIWKLQGAAGIAGSRMPFGGPYLSAETIDLFIRWIQQGAERN